MVSASANRSSGSNNLLVRLISTFLTGLSFAVVGAAAPTAIHSLRLALEFAAFYVFWWCLLAACGIGWTTLAVGAVTGLVIGVTHRIVIKRRHPYRNHDPSMTSQDARPRPWSSLGASLISLGICTVISGVCLFTIRTNPPPISHEPVREQAAPFVPDETAILACAAYVDLSPIRAALAETFESSDFTSAQKQALDVQSKHSKAGSQAPTGRCGSHLPPVDLQERSAKTA